MASANIQNANILYDFIITEQNHTNVNFLQDYHISKSFVYLIDIFINYNKSVIVMDSFMFNWYAISHTVSRNGLAKEGSSKRKPC